MPGHRLRAYLITAVLVGLAAAPARARDDKRDALWSAVRAGDTKAIHAALDKGAAVNATNEIGVSALWIAASNGKFDVIELLVKRGADVNVRDGIWYMTPLSMSASGKKLDTAKLLIKSGAKDVDAALTSAASGRGRREGGEGTVSACECVNSAQGKISSRKNQRTHWPRTETPKTPTQTCHGLTKLAV